MQNRLKRFIAIMLSMLMVAGSFVFTQAEQNYYEPLLELGDLPFEMEDLAPDGLPLEDLAGFTDMFDIDELIALEEYLFPGEESELLLFGDEIEPFNDTGINFARLLRLSLYAFDANMCGPNVATRSRLAWRNNCHNASDNNRDIPSRFRGTSGRTTIDVRGGFHDAGDHIKFNLPISFGMSTLALAVYLYEDQFIAAGALCHARRLLDHYASFLRNSTIRNDNGTGSFHAFVYQVGDGQGGGGRGSAYDDHAFWGRPENQSGSGIPGRNRYVYFTDLSSTYPGTEQVAVAAAFLAANYVNFGRASDLAYARVMFAAVTGSHTPRLARRGVSTEGGAGRNFYRAEHHLDKVALAGEWMALARNSNSYRRTDRVPNRNWPLTWDNHWPKVLILRGIAGVDSSPAPSGSATSSWSMLASHYFTGSGGNVVRFGSPNTYQVWSNWGNSRANAAMQGVALAYANFRSHSANAAPFAAWARGQMRFLLGNNTSRNSFVMGYPSIGGTPTVAQANIRIHHRGAHTPTSQTGSSWTRFNDNAAPANFLTGALVGGPGNDSHSAPAGSGNFRNNIRYYEHTEVTIDYNASLVLAAAGFMRRFSPTATFTGTLQGSFRTLPACAAPGCRGCVSAVPPTSITVSPATATVMQGGTQEFSVTATVPADASRSVTWSITPAVSGASINSSGVLTVGSSVPAGTTINVRATSTVATNVTRNVTVTVVGTQNIRFRWGPARTAGDINVNQVSTQHVFRLTQLEITDCMVALGEDATLLVRFVNTAGGNRRLLVWTDRSSPSTNRNNIAYLTPANIESGAVLRINPRIESADTTAEITIPFSMLAGQTSRATRLYIALTTDTDNKTSAANHRGGGTHNEIPTRFQHVELTIRAHEAATNPTACASCSNLPCRCVEVIPPAVSNVAASPATVAAAGGNSTITVTGTNLVASSVRIGAFLNNAGSALYTRTPTGSATSVSAALAFPANTGTTNRVYTIRVSTDGGTTFLTTPVTTVTVSAPVPEPSITSVSASPITLPAAGGSSTVTAAGSNLVPANVRIGAFLNNAGSVLYTQTPTGSATSVSAALAFPANTDTTNRVYTIRVSVNGGTSWLTTPVATVTVSAPPVNPNILGPFDIVFANPIVSPYIFDLQTYLATVATGAIPDAGTTHLVRTHGDPTPPVTLSVSGAVGSRSVTVTRPNTNQTRGLLLRGITFEAGDVVTVTGEVLTTATALNMRLQTHTSPNNMPSIAPTAPHEVAGQITRTGGGNNAAGPFTITWTVPAGVLPQLASGLRVLLHGAGTAGTYRIDNLTVYRPSLSNMSDDVEPFGGMELWLDRAGVQYDAQGLDLWERRVPFVVSRTGQDAPAEITFDEVFVAGPTPPGIEWQVVKYASGVDERVATYSPGFGWSLSYPSQILNIEPFSAQFALSGAVPGVAPLPAIPLGESAVLPNVVPAPGPGGSLPPGYTFTWRHITGGTIAPGSVVSLTPSGASSAISSTQAGTARVEVEVTPSAIVNHPITFNSNGGSGTMPNQESAGTNFTLPANGFTAPAHHVFEGWSRTQTGGTVYAVGQQITNVSAPLTLFARWNRTEWPLATLIAPTARTLEAPAATSAEVISQLNAAVSSVAITTNPARDVSANIAWTFTGTFNSAQGATNSFTWTATLPPGVVQVGGTPAVSGSVIITNYTQAIVNHPITFNSNGGSGTMANQESAGTNFTLPANGFTPPANYDFEGWSRTQTGGTVYAVGHQITDVTAPLTLFARWTPLAQNHPITVVSDGATDATASLNLALPGTPIALSAETHDPDFEFSRWISVPPVDFADATDPNTTFDMVDAPVVIIATWQRSFNNVGPGAKTISVVVDSIMDSNAQFIGMEVHVTITGGTADRYYIETQVNFRVRVGNPTIENMTKPVTVPVPVGADGGGTGSIFVPVEDLNDFAREDLDVEPGTPVDTQIGTGGVIVVNGFTVTLNANGATIVRCLGEISTCGEISTFSVSADGNSRMSALPGMLDMEIPNGDRFAGWLIDGTDEFLREGDEITADMTVTAEWVPRANINGGRFQLGDVNGDGRVTTADATAMARWIQMRVNNPTAVLPDEWCHYAADITGTGARAADPTLNDLVLLSRWLVGHRINNLIAH